MAKEKELPEVLEEEERLEKERLLREQREREALEAALQRKRQRPAKVRKIVTAFGRFNPPTTGHAKIVEEVRRLALQHDAEALIFTSQTQDAKKNPLTFTDKMRFLKQFFPDMNFCERKDVRTPADALMALSLAGYTHVCYVVGADRVQSFQWMYRYIVPRGEAKSKTDIEIDDFRIRGIERSESDVSASHARMLAQTGDFESFRKLIPTRNDKVAKQVYDTVRRQMHVKDG